MAVLVWRRSEGRGPRPPRTRGDVLCARIGRALPLPHPRLEPAQQDRQADRHGQVDQRHHVVGLEIAEVPRRRDLAQLRDVATRPAPRRGSKSFTIATKSLPERRQDRPERLRKDDVAKPLPAVQAKRLRRLDLALVDRLQARAEDLGQEGGIGDGQRDDRAPDQRESRGCAIRASPSGAVSQFQQRDKRRGRARRPRTSSSTMIGMPRIDLDIKPRRLPQHRSSRDSAISARPRPIAQASVKATRSRRS